MRDPESQLRQVLAEIQDFLAPRLDSYEQMLYHFLFRHSRLEGHREISVGIRSLRARVGLGIGKAGSPPSEARVTEKLRSLERKGCVRILERSRSGTRVEVFLPSEIPGCIPAEPGIDPVELEQLDFFNAPELRLRLLAREHSRCFYCLRSISKTSFTVDHLAPQSGASASHSYRNVVACCFECNSRKRDLEASAFVTQIYRDGLLSAEEHRLRLGSIEDLRAGKLVPPPEAAG